MAAFSGSLAYFNATANKNTVTLISINPFVSPSVQINSISNIDDLSALQFLYLNQNNNISSLGTLPSGLLELDISYNNFTSLPSGLPNTLTYLEVSVNPLSSSFNSSSVLPSALETFNCNLCAVSSIPTLPSTLTQFQAQQNRLVSGSLQNLPSALTVIALGANALTAIPTIPVGVIELDVSFNPFTATAINTICGQLVTNNQSNGTLNLTSCTTSLAASNIATLQGRGWLVFT